MTFATLCGTSPSSFSYPFLGMSILKFVHVLRNALTCTRWDSNCLQYSPWMAMQETITLPKKILKILHIITVPWHLPSTMYSLVSQCKRQLSTDCNHYPSSGIKMIHSVELLNTNPHPLLSLSQQWVKIRQSCIRDIKWLILQD